MAKRKHDSASHRLQFRVRLTQTEIDAIKDNASLARLLEKKKLNVDKALARLRYEQDLEQLQIELVKLHRAVREQGRRIAIVFEGRDTAGKSSAIRRFVANLNPRSARIVALPNPTDVEKGQWFFQRYVAHLPNPGEIVFFDRSWYNRAVVEPVNGFCTEEQYRIFMEQVPEFEHMLYEDNLELLKLWFAVSPEVQAERFESRRTDPLKQWKLSPLDDKAEELWDRYTRYIDAMFRMTHTSFSPWMIVNANDQKRARLETIRHVLWQLDYDGKDTTGGVRAPDPERVAPYDPHAANRG